MPSPPKLLSEYPSVEVRVGCRRCGRLGVYRLARLAVRFGSEFPLQRLLGGLAGDCPWRNGTSLDERCGACFLELEGALPSPDRTGAETKMLADWRVIKMSAVCTTCGLHETYRRADLIANSPVNVTLDAVLSSLIRNCRNQRVSYLKAKCHAQLVGH